MWVEWLIKDTDLLFLFIDMGRAKFVSLLFEIIEVCIVYLENMIFSFKVISYFSPYYILIIEQN